MIRTFAFLILLTPILSLTFLSSITEINPTASNAKPSLSGSILYKDVLSNGSPTSCTDPYIINVHAESVLDTLVVDARDGNDFFEFTVPANGHLTISSCRADFSRNDQKVYVYIDDCDNLITDLIGNVSCVGVGTIDYSIPVFEGDTYLFEWGLDPDQPAVNQIDSVFDVVFYYRKEIAGTTCETAHNLSCLGEFELDVRGVDQWYTWTAPNSGQYTLGVSADETAAYNFGIPMEIYNGSTCATKSLFTDNDTEDLDFIPSISFMATAGEVYYFVFRDQPNPSADGPISAELIEVGMPSTNTAFHEDAEILICEDYFFDGQLLTETGTYHGGFISAMGCDSTVTLNLTIFEQTATSEESVESCESYDWNGTRYTTSGTYQEMFINGAGCDSTAILNLTILEATTSSETVAACGSYEWNGTNYNTSGTYTEIFINQVGCDSTVNLTIDIIPEPIAEAEINRNVLVANDITGATYQWFDCDTNIPLAGQDNQQLNPPGSGDYYVEVTSDGCSTISACVSFNLVTALNVKTNEEFSIYPTVTANSFALDANKKKKDVRVRILTTNGKLVKEYQYKRFTSSKFSLSGQSNGVYLVQIIVEGQEMNTFRVIKK